MYIVEKNTDGRVIGVRKYESEKDKSKGELILEDYDDQRYCDFLNWISRRPTEWGSDFSFYYENSLFFASPNNLIEYCKRQGKMLWVKMDVYGNHDYGISDGLYPALERISITPQKPQNGFGRLRIAAPNVNNAEDPTGITYEEVFLYATWTAIESMKRELLNDESDARRISNLPITRSFVYIDVSDFSRFPPGQQALVINSIVRVVQDEELWLPGIAKKALRGLEAQICIGDGYIYVFKDPEDAVYFASCFGHYIERLIAQQVTRLVPVEFHFRMGIHSGPVYCFWDPGRKDWNYIGDGINGGQRVLAAAGKDKDDVIYVSGELRKALHSKKPFDSNLVAIRRCMQNRGRHLDKHGNPWRIYEINHDDLVTPCIGELDLS